MRPEALPGVWLILETAPERLIWRGFLPQPTCCLLTPVLSRSGSPVDGVNLPSVIWVSAATPEGFLGQRDRAAVAVMDVVS